MRAAMPVHTTRAAIIVMAVPHETRFAPYHSTRYTCSQRSGTDDSSVVNYIWSPARESTRGPVVGLKVVTTTTRVTIRLQKYRVVRTNGASRTRIGPIFGKQTTDRKIENRVIFRRISLHSRNNRLHTRVRLMLSL